MFGNRNTNQHNRSFSQPSIDSKKGCPIDDQKEAPQDSTLCIAFINETTFLTGGWDLHLRGYSISREPPYLSSEKLLYIGAPITSINWLGGFKVVVASAYGILLGIDLNSDKIEELQNFESVILKSFKATIKGVDMIIVVLACGKVAFFDLQNLEICLTADFGQMIIDADFSAEADNMVAVALMSTKFWVGTIYELSENLNNLEKMIQDSTLITKLSLIRLQPHGKSLFMCSVEGRATFFYKTSRTRTPKFEKHVLYRSRGDDKNYHAGIFACYSTLQKSGFRHCVVMSNADFSMTFWNADQKNKGLEMNRVEGNVTCMAFSPSSEYLVYATGLSWVGGIGEVFLKDRGELRYPPGLWVKRMSEEDFKKSKKA